MSVTFTEACGMHAASWAFEAVRRSWVIVGACEARACEGLWLAAPALPVTMPAIAAVQAAAGRVGRRGINGPPGRGGRSLRRTGGMPYFRARGGRRMRGHPAGAAGSPRLPARGGAGGPG